MKTPGEEMEILAPAGGMESLVAAVRCGADAVYLGGPTLNARRGATNFDENQLSEAVAYCHARNTRVYLTLNTVVFDHELAEAEAAIETACRCGVDALIVQDLSVARLARECAPSLERHASTQMSIHNLEGVRALEELGFSRVVAARELTRGELAEITGKTGVLLESFVHGSLCVSLSGSCYLSSMIGGRSGNRGLCAQPCRLPFHSEGSGYALSLRDLTLIDRIGELREAGVRSLKIEGRLKRPEYVAAAVTACVAARRGETPDLEELAAVFSRNGFTAGYFLDKRGDEMFGTRRQEDVVAAAPVHKKLAGLYRNETPRVPVRFTLKARSDGTTLLTARSGKQESHVHREAAQPALTTPTTPERAGAALEKTGGTPFFAESVECSIDPDLMIPAAALNEMRRHALEELLALREKTEPHSFTPFRREKTPWEPSGETELRVRLSSFEQFDPALWKLADKLILPLDSVPELGGLSPERLILELPRVSFDGPDRQEALLARAAELGILDVLAGNLGSVWLGRSRGFRVHGDFTLNAVNTLALEEYATLGCVTMTMSFECPLPALRSLGGGMPRGVAVYGSLPLMTLRNRPAGMKADEGELTDRLGNRFRVEREGDAYTMWNCVPLWLADRMDEFSRLDFLTLHFTRESAGECVAVAEAYRSGEAPKGEITRGLYYRGVQ